MRIEDTESLHEVQDRLVSMVDAGDAAGAVALVMEVESDSARVLNHLRAWVLTEAGGLTKDASWVESGIEYWLKLGSVDSAEVAYNVANGRLSLFEIARSETDLATALETRRDDLRVARSLFDRVGDNDQADDGLRVRALTNSGNALDGVGRDLEALGRYQAALKLDPGFGMALGNRATALAHYAPFAEQHSSTMRRLARQDLELALKDRTRVLSIGGPSTLRNFEKKLEVLPEVVPPQGDRRTSGAWADPHLAWCEEHGLFLHVSPDCIDADDGELDELYFRALSVGLSETDQGKSANIVDAFNALKQDYLAARLSAWLVLDKNSPARSPSEAVAARARFWDSLNYSRWGPRTGLLLQALASATNLLDKVASFLHLYYETGVQRPYFRTFWKKSPRSTSDNSILPKFRKELETDRFNTGLLAIIDLARDQDEDTSLGRFLEVRHAATHRFVVAHDSTQDGAGREVLRVERGEIEESVLEALRVARAAIIYLVRVVNVRETRMSRERKELGEIAPTLPVTLIDDLGNEWL